MPRGAASSPGGQHHAHEVQHGQGEQHARGSNMLRGERHAQGEQNGRGSSMRMGSSIKGLCIASLHKIEDNFISGFEFEKQLYV
jgi:hypothetical protein